MVNVALGNRIKAIREKMGKNQEEFGKMFNPPAPKSAVSRWEHGGSPNKRRLAKIAELGDMTVDELVNGSLFEVINELTTKLYDEYFNYLAYMSETGRSWEGYVNQMSHNADERTNYRNMSQFFAYIEHDKFIDLPEEISNVDIGVSLTKEEKRSLEKYESENLIAGFKYCANRVLKLATAEKIDANNTSALIRLFYKVELQHFMNHESNDEGLLNTANSGLDDVINNVYSLVYGPNYKSFNQRNFSDVEIPNSINKKLYKNVSEILESAKEKIASIANDNGITLDD